VNEDNEHRRTQRSLVPGILLSGAAVVGLVVVADPARALEILMTARPAEISAAAVVSGLSLIARAAASRQLVDARVGLGGSFAALNIGYLANNLLPFRAGEAIRSVVLGRRSGLGIIGGAAAVAAERMLDVTFAATILIASLPAAGVDAGWAPPVIAAMAALTGVTVLLVVARRRDAIVGWLHPRFAPRPRLAALLPRLAAAFDGLAKPHRLLRASEWLSLSWILGLSYFWLVLRAFIPEAPLSWAALALGVLAFGIALPSSPGAIGVYEAALVGAMALCGVDSASALAFAVASHALSFTITSTCGLVALIRQVPGGEGIADRARSLLGKNEAVTPDDIGP
jgi:uncharacterized membrane protein YbhN (UPF0104 family)